MISTTGTCMESYFDWIKRELEGKLYGEVSIVFTVTNGQITNVKKGSFDNEHYDLKKVNK